MLARVVDVWGRRAAVRQQLGSLLFLLLQQAAGVVPCEDQQSDAGPGKSTANACWPSLRPLRNPGQAHTCQRVLQHDDGPVGWCKRP